MRLVYLGTGAIGLPSLQALHEREGWELVGVVTQPDRPAGRGKRLLASPVKEWASRAGVPVEQPESVNDSAALQRLCRWEADVVVVCAFGQILKPPILNWPKCGCLNIHASLLPRHRGASCIQAALLADDAETGISVIQMDPGLDTGDVLGSAAIGIEPGETADGLHDRLAELAPSVLLRVLEELKRGESSPEPQDGEQATYAPKLSRRDGDIDWERPAPELERKIRAYHSWPGTFSFFTTPRGESKRLKISPPVSVESARGEPGTVIRTEDGAGVICGNQTMISLSQVQPEGSRSMSAGEWLRGFPGIIRLARAEDR